MTVKVKSNLKKLDNLIEGLKEKHSLHIGIIGSKAKEVHKTDGKQTLNNATIGATHEFGSKKKKIPARSFLRMPVEQKEKDIKTRFVANKNRNEQNLLNGNIISLYGDIGILAEQVIQEAFETKGFGQWKPNSPVTIAKKKSSSPLIDTGQLRRSISSRVV